ncbi:MAG: tRNA pseudouridine(55) synthase TruB [Pseudomonadota bacterium]
MARKRRGRAINGIVLFDKPLGLSSNQALQRVRRLFNAAKAGHTGSLDPAASGLLPVCFGQATRISGLLLDADKTYRVTGRLGVKTDSGDLEGEVIETRDVPSMDAGDLEPILARFRGRVEQIPPMHSALKQDGKRLYELAREGKTVERKARVIDFHEITLEAFDGREFTLRVHSSKGAYIRTLVEDIGEAVGCGAVVTVLRRIGLGPWSMEPAEGGEPDRCRTLEELEALATEGGLEALDRVILPIDSALGAYPAVVLDASSVNPIRHGHPVFVPNAPQTGWFRLYSPDDLFLGMGEVLDDGRTAPRRLFAAL